MSWTPESAGALPDEPQMSIRPTGQSGPEDEALLADSVGVAPMVGPGRAGELLDPNAVVGASPSTFASEGVR
ncbi:hypothetical protein [Actinomadura decatromicini]|uniref:hypothetical protein n=1 Tax=Actinomadura decatromicini TaxID=2604572 RepID=UPI001FE9FCC4|nr:hypothetical protein [Actinomadura decatromicini]